MSEQLPGVEHARIRILAQTMVPAEAKRRISDFEAAVRAECDQQLAQAVADTKREERQRVAAMVDRLASTYSDPERRTTTKAIARYVRESVPAPLAGGESAS